MRSRPTRDVDALLADFRRQCRDAGMSLTHQREIIFRTLVEMDGHPSPEAIYLRVKEQIPAISMATVYKNLNTFLETGLTREVSLHHGALRLETNSAPHHHFVCVHCKEIFDIEDDLLMPAKLRPPLPEGFEVQRCSVEFQGTCRECGQRPSLS
jgi:Fur family transcriptional regulator, peroxide stress response regulator